jgi:molecular chaperone GrpE
MPAHNEPVDPKHEAPSPDTSEHLEVNPQAGPDDEAQHQAHEAEQDWASMLSDAQEKVAKYHDELLRAKAEVENIRRRAQDDVAKARKFGTESFAESLVPVKDSLEAALAQPDQTAQAWQEGVEITLKQLTAAFERNLLKEVAPAVGDTFDPNVHQAISSIPADQPKGTVVQLLQKGYTIADRVLRPALVTVSAGPA